MCRSFRPQPLQTRSGPFHAHRPLVAVSKASKALEPFHHCDAVAPADVGASALLALPRLRVLRGPRRLLHSFVNGAGPPRWPAAWPALEGLDSARCCMMRLCMASLVANLSATASGTSRKLVCLTPPEVCLPATTQKLLLAFVGGDPMPAQALGSPSCSFCQRSPLPFPGFEARPRFQTPAQSRVRSKTPAVGFTSENCLLGTCAMML